MSLLKLGACHRHTIKCRIVEPNLAQASVWRIHFRSVKSSGNRLRSLLSVKGLAKTLMPVERRHVRYSRSL